MAVFSIQAGYRREQKGGIGGEKIVDLHILKVCPGRAEFGREVAK